MKRTRPSNQGSDLLQPARTAPKVELTQPHLLPYLLNRLTSRLNQVWLEEIREAGLTVPRWQVLSILAAFDGSRIGQIAELCGNEQPVVSRVIDQMERDGLVLRHRGEDDSRVVQVWLTDQARRVLVELQPSAERYIARLLSRVGTAEVAQAMQVLSRILTNLDEPE